MTKSTYNRADRVADQIRMEVADILMRKIKDPRVRSVTVTDVELTKDLRIARVFVTTMEQNKDERHVFDGLAKASGFVRAELGRRLALRYLPESFASCAHHAAPMCSRQWKSTSFATSFRCRSRVPR